MTRAHSSVLDADLVQGPSTAVANRVSAFDGVTGKQLKDSGLSVGELSSLLTSSSLMALQVADTANTAVFLGSGLADHFEDLTYVDVAGGVNLDISTSGVLKPTTSADTYSTSLDYPTGGWSNIADFNNYQARQFFPAAAFNFSGSAVRITITPPTSGSNFVLDDMWFGDAGTGANFTGNQVRVTFNGGQTGVTVAAGGSPIVSDVIAFDFNMATPKMISKDFGATSAAFAISGATDYISYQKSFSSGEAAQTVVTDYAANAGYLVATNKIEVRTALGTWNNMIVLSTGLTAQAEPTDMRALLLVDEVSEATPGVDYTFECSRDNGASLYSMVLSELFMLPNGQRVIEASSLDMTGKGSGLLPRWRFNTLNNKNVELHGVHFQWSTGESP